MSKFDYSLDSDCKRSDGKKPVGRPKKAFSTYEKESLAKIARWRAELQQKKKDMSSKDKQQLRNKISAQESRLKIQK